MRVVSELTPKEKKVVVRVDWNVTLGRALQVVDDTRIRRTERTIKYLVDGGAKQVVLVSHLGKAEEKRSIRPVALYAAKLLGEEIELCATVSECHRAKGRLVMLENVRLWAGEEKNDPEFVRELVSLGEVYVNEGFGVSHRNSASVIGIAKLLPSYAGFNLTEEVRRIERAMEEPKRPLIVVMGGAKVKDKIKLLKVMSEKADSLLLGGKLANEYMELGLKLEARSEVLLPVDGVGEPYLDIGEKTQKMFAEKIAKAKTVIWNGPMGKVEEEEYRAGTHAVYEALTHNESAEVIVGGGDTLAAIRNEKHLERIDFVSTGGGAMLELIEKGSLPGLEVLK